ncbi:MAG: hypothetical protein U9N34_00315 [Candidatus Cloacimonadota bacterium]|nr:hypothetical protein [Candidatus Cloacimonadota bacterium]
MKNKFIFVISILIAIFLWFQLKLNNKYYENIDIPIKIENVPLDNYVVEQSIYLAEVKFYGKGLDLLKLRFSQPEIVIDGEKHHKRNNKVNLTENLLVYNDNNIKFQNVVGTNFVDFKVDKFQEDSKQVKVKYKTKADKEYFSKKKLVITPEKILVFGPATDLKELNYVHTEEISRVNISKNKISVNLIEPQNLKLYTNKIEIEIVKTEIIQKYLTHIPIKIPIDFNKSIIPQKVSVLIKGPKQIINNTYKENITAKLNRAHLDREFAKLYFTLPDNVELLDYSPSKVRIIENE